MPEAAPQREFERRAEAARRASHFLCPKPRSGRSPKQSVFNEKAPRAAWNRSAIPASNGASTDCSGASPVASALGIRARRDPGAADQTYHGRPKPPLKTGTFYFARNRKFLLCLDRGAFAHGMAWRRMPGRQEAPMPPPATSIHESPRELGAGSVPRTKGTRRPRASGPPRGPQPGGDFRGCGFRQRPSGLAQDFRHRSCWRAGVYSGRMASRSISTATDRCRSVTLMTRRNSSRMRSRMP
jgi:hypothetical protein